MTNHRPRAPEQRRRRSSTPPPAARSPPLDSGRPVLRRVVPAGGEVEVVDLEKHLEQYRDRPRRKTGHLHGARRRVVRRPTSPSTASPRPRCGPTSSAPDRRCHQRPRRRRRRHRRRPRADEFAGWGDHRVEFTSATPTRGRRGSQHDGKLLTSPRSPSTSRTGPSTSSAPPPRTCSSSRRRSRPPSGCRSSPRSSSPPVSGSSSTRRPVDARPAAPGARDPEGLRHRGPPLRGRRRRTRCSPGSGTASTDGTLRIGYRLERPADILREAFLGVLSAIEGDIEHPVYRGTSA
jgi:hypothetical protein